MPLLYTVPLQAFSPANIRTRAQTHVYVHVHAITLRAMEAELNIFSDGCLSPSF